MIVAGAEIRSRPARVRGLTALVVGVLLLTGSPSMARPPADLENLEAARLALAKEGDCDRAVELLDSVTTARKSSTRWIELAARANECSGRLAAAISYYQELDLRLPRDERRSDKIAELEERHRSRLDSREHDLLAQMGSGLEASEDDAPPAALAEPLPLPRVEGSWLGSDIQPTRGAFGETYARKLRLEIDGKKVRLTGHVFVEPELRDEKYLDGAVHWYEAEATGTLLSNGIEISGVCTSKVWSFDRAGVLPGDEAPISGQFVYVGDGESLSYRGDATLEIPCGIDFGQVHRSLPASRR